MRSGVRVTACAAFAVACLIAPEVRANSDAIPYTLSTATFIGDLSSTDGVRGVRIQADGTVVLAANVGAPFTNATPILLNGATSASPGAIIRFAPDGKAVLSLTRVGARVEDLSIDGAGNIYAALWTDGAVKLDPAATTVLWSRRTGKAARIDAGDDGNAVVLLSSAASPEEDAPGPGTVEVLAPDGTLVNSSAGKSNTLDVCLHAPSQTLVLVGWRQASVGGTPVQIAYLQGRAFDGSVRYTGYDWSTDAASDRFINKPENNMADTRGYRCAIGGDGKLYAAFEAAGGNHIFRYSPFDISSKVSSVGGDVWHTFSNTRAEHKTFFGRYDAATGAYAAGQQFVTRLTAAKNNAGNTVRVRRGAIAADALGRVYLGGESAWGLPMPPHPAYKAKAGETTFNHLASNPDAYLGGAWFMVMSADLKTRLFVTRLAEGGNTDAVDARIVAGQDANVVFAGRTTSITTTYTLAPLQPSAAGGSQEGWIAVIAPGIAPARPLTNTVSLPVVRR